MKKQYQDFRQIYFLLLFGILNIDLIAGTSLLPGVNADLPPLPFEMPKIRLPEFPEQRFDIRDFGATGDGQTLNTVAFEQAISACEAAGGAKS